MANTKKMLTPPPLFGHFIHVFIQNFNSKDFALSQDFYLNL